MTLSDGALKAHVHCLTCSGETLLSCRVGSYLVRTYMTS